MTLLLLALALLVASGAASLVTARARAVSTFLGTAGGAIGCALGLFAAGRAVLAGREESLRVAWSIPHAAFALELDPLAAFFLVPVFALPALAVVYGRAYMAHETHGAAAARFGFNLLVASMALVVLAQNGVLFLVAWELMALSAFALVTFDHHDAEVRRAGFVYLVATHTGTLALIALFVLFAARAGSYDFSAFAAAHVAGPLGVVLFVLALVGFGVKAGFVPLHVWLPEAHAAAPSHVSAVMSGVMLKMGIYGILRVLTLLGPPRAFWGPTLMTVGLTSAALGMAFALTQRDLKRALAYSSVENMGIVTLGLGVGYLGAANGRPDVATLGAAGGLLHVWNHTLMKGAMFLGAGSVLHGAGTKDLERLGGLLRRMPRTGAAMIAGAVALSALPPMNGFVSEWLLYMGLVRAGLSPSGPPSVAALLATGVLAFVGAMAALCFLRLTGIAHLGSPRSDAAREAHESPPSMTLPIFALLAAAAAIALFPAHVVGALARAAAVIHGGAPGATPDAPLATLGACNGAVLVAIALAWGLFAALRKRPIEAAGPTWGCGYVAPTTRMQYTARAFVELFGAKMLPERLRPRFVREEPRGLFPRPGAFASDPKDPITRDVYEPLVDVAAGRFARLRWLQQGVLHAYIFYILVFLVIALAWVAFGDWLRG